MSDTPDPLSLVEEMERDINLLTSTTVTAMFAVAEVRSLCEAVRAARTQLTTAKSALENWGRHHPWCVYMPPNTEGVAVAPCNCGYRQAIAAASPIGPETP